MAQSLHNCLSRNLLLSLTHTHSHTFKGGSHGVNFPEHRRGHHIAADVHNRHRDSQRLRLGWRSIRRFLKIEGCSFAQHCAVDHVCRIASKFPGKLQREDCGLHSVVADRKRARLCGTDRITFDRDSDSNRRSHAPSHNQT
jgi:hypothetical protein